MKVDILINKDGKETVFIQSNTFRKGTIYQPLRSGRI